MRNVTQRTIGAVAGLIAFIAGCGEPTSAPTRLSAQYVLSTVNGNALPAVASQGAQSEYIVLADSMSFQLDGQVRRSSTLHWLSTFVPIVDTVYTVTAVYPYTVQDSTVTIGSTRPCADNANCVGFARGTITPQAVVIRETLHWPEGPEFVFDRR